MAKQRKVGFATKLLSNRNYIKEVSVEGKATHKFNFNIGFYDQYAAQVIRIGNCITLLSNNFSINKETFWNTNYFEDLTKYIFWTFNRSFLFELTSTIDTLNNRTLYRCRQLLEENLIPYDSKIEDDGDEELHWCLVKNRKLKNDPKFEQMYILDQENRTALLSALIKKSNSDTIEENQPQIAFISPVTTESKSRSFLDLLKPINNNPHETLKLITAKTEEADFEFDLFSKVNKLPNGKNPYGLNGAITAMIDFFYQHNYFKKDYSLEEIFKAYSTYTGNSIAKLKTFLSEFRQDNSYLKHFNKLKQLKINKMK